MGTNTLAYVKTLDASALAYFSFTLGCLGLFPYFEYKHTSLFQVLRV
jgi:hypothetical protein